MIGQILDGRYEIQRELGSGGLATVYLGQDRQSGGSVAVKVLRPHVAPESDSHARFEREARLMRSLADPHFVQVTDFGRTGTQPFLVMEYVEGSTLKALIQKEGTLSAQRSACIARQVAEGLGAIHRRGVIHRDIKPQNIMVKPDDSIKVMDFGVAKAVDMNTLTRTGFMVGTPHYIAPEQAMGDAADPRSDIYSLGVVFYEMLTGQVPFSGRTPVAILMKHLNDPVPADWAEHCHIAPAVVDLVNRCLAKTPAGRYENATTLVAAIDALALAHDWDLRVPACIVPAGAAADDRTLILSRGEIDATLAGQNVHMPAAGAVTAWSTSTLRELLTATFDEEGLTAFCGEHFPDVYAGFTAELGQRQKVRRLLEHCKQHGKTEVLLQLVAAKNPSGYNQFVPRR